MLPPLAPVFLSYVLSFVYVGIYWNNHHHMLHTCQTVDGAVLWANLHLLFWLSLIPFATGWMGENHFAPLPAALYGVDAPHARHRLLHPSDAPSFAPWHGQRPGAGARNDFKGKISPVLYLVAIVLAFFIPWISHRSMCWWR